MSDRTREAGSAARRARAALASVLVAALATLVASAVAPAAARADSACGRVFRKLRPAPPKDQCRSEECYLFAFMTVLETRNANRRGLLESPALSAPYLVARKLEDWAEQAVWSGPYATYYLAKRGQVHHAASLVHRHGLLTEAEFRPPVPFADWKLDELVPELERRAGELHAEVAELRHARGDADPRALEAARERADSLKARVRALAGEARPEQAAANARELGLPDGAGLHVAYSGANWTPPADFALRMRQLGEWQGRPTSVVEVAPTLLETGLMRLIDAGEPAYLALETPTGRHAAVGTGYAREGERLSHVRIQDSHGPGRSGRGSYWFTADRFRERLLGIAHLDPPPAPPSAPR